MYRWHSPGDQHIMHARKKFAVIDYERFMWFPPINHEQWFKEVNQLGRWRWRHPRDCGHTRCASCHYDKYYVKSGRENVKRKAIEFELAAEAPERGPFLWS